LEKALRYYQEFMTITVPKLGETHRDVAIMLKCMAQIYHEQREYDKALSLYEEALNVGRAALGIHAEVASILNNMGNLYHERGDFDAALERYKEGLEVERAVLHDLHPNITVTLTNIAQIHKQRGEYAAALKL
jgi:tetratricopeptide (TPR) repeat protein